MSSWLLAFQLKEKAETIVKAQPLLESQRRHNLQSITEFFLCLGTFEPDEDDPAEPFPIHQGVYGGGFVIRSMAFAS